MVQATFGTEDSRIRKKVLRALRVYIDTYVNQKFTPYSIDDSDLSRTELARAWLADFTARALYYDIKKFYPETAPDISDIRKTITEKIILNPKQPAETLLQKTDKKALEEELLTFFEEESEIYIDNARDIEKTVQSLITYAEKSRVEKNDINALMKKVIPTRYWVEDPQSIPNTDEFVYAKIKKAQDESRTRAIADDMKTLFTRYGHDQILRKKIEDDLWVLNRNSFEIPASFSEGKAMPPNPVKDMRMNVELTGMFMISERLNNSLIKSQVQSIIIAIVVVWLLLSLQFKSMKTGLVVLSPIVLVILINFAIMGYTKIPLDYATMLVGSILIGVGIDYSIHFSSRFKSEFEKQSDVKSSLEKTLGSTGIAIVINALMVALGFFVLVAGQFVPTKREGWMIGVLMILSAFAALIYLPSLILLLRKFVRFDGNSKRKNGFYKE